MSSLWCNTVNDINRCSSIDIKKGLPLPSGLWERRPLKFLGCRKCKILREMGWKEDMGSISEVRGRSLLRQSSSWFALCGSFLICTWTSPGFSAVSVLPPCTLWDRAIYRVSGEAEKKKKWPGHSTWGKGLCIIFNSQRGINIWGLCGTTVAFLPSVLMASITDAEQSRGWWRKLRAPPTSASRGLELKECATTAQLNFYVFRSLLFKFIIFFWYWG